MNELRAGLLLFAAAVLYNCGSSDERVTVRDGAGGEAGGEAGDGGQGGVTDVGAAPGGAGAASDAAAGTTSGGASGGAELGAAGATPMGRGGAPEAGEGGSDGAGGAVVLPDGVLANVPYTCSSPFDGVDFPSYFHFEDFEDHALSTPGVSASTSTLSSSFGASVIDSVDCDDGAIDGVCTDCDALWGNGSVEVTFDAVVLGALPTHVGMVWTDGGGNASVTITAYDAADEEIYAETVEGIGDASISGTTEEDRFFGIVHADGVKRVRVVNSTGGVEIDHLQYGR